MLIIETMIADDWPTVEAIYRQGIATRQATFETETPSWEVWDTRHAPAPRLVARLDGCPVGWAALSPVSVRTVYRGVAEASVYVAEWSRGQGVGRALLIELVRQSEALGYWTLQASIFPENTASLALHAACGFRQVGRRERLGQLDGVWHDVLLLERRSAVVGSEPRCPNQDSNPGPTA